MTPVRHIAGFVVRAMLGVVVALAAAAAPITVPFDHLATGFELDGVHRDLPCESCHLNAVFKGTPRSCGLCHITGSVFNATPKIATHIQSTNNCAACHNTISFRPYVHFDHAEVQGSCVSCHNGSVAQGEGPTHPATSKACDACHTVMSWNPPKSVDHTQIPLAVAGYCIICHNGTQASGKPAGHIATSLECGDCHLSTTWLGASFDHSGILTGCASCHNGVKAAGKQGNHMPTTDRCENCHRTGIGSATPQWVPSLFDHTQMSVTTCASCHSGSIKISTGFVTGQPVNHVPPIPSKIDCGVCHGNTPAAETWTVLAASIATLHTGLNVNNCLLCHAGENFAGVPAPYIPMSISGISPTRSTPLSPPHIPILAGSDCSSCHGPAYSAGGFGPATAMTGATHSFVSTTCDTCHDSGRSFYVGSGTPLQLRPADHIASADTRMASGDCSLCHETKDWASSALPAGHMPNPANLSCAQCHASAPADYTPATLASNATLHTGISGNCSLCHGNYVSALTWFSNFTPKDAILSPSHIPYLSGTDCSTCHASLTYAPGTFGPTGMTAAKHAFVPSTCDTCHEAGLSFYLGASTPALQGRPADHISSGNPQQQTGDCSSCHTPVDWTSNTMPPGHMPNPGNERCSVCHTAIGGTLASYATLASIAVLHTGISANCSQCHGGTSGQLTFYNNNDNPLAAVLNPAHIPTLSGSDCSSCHAANYVTGGFGPTPMNAAKHAFVTGTCDTCHEAGLSFYMGSSTPALQGRPADHTAAGGALASSDCSMCHTPADWSAKTLPPGHMPNPGNQACAVCHTGIGTTFASYATLASISVLHTGISGNCGQCHGGPSGQLTFYNNNDNPKAAVLTPSHIPYLNGSDCSACHAANYVTGGFGPTSMSAAKHAFVPSTCDTCHEAGLAFYLGASTPALQGRPATHVSSPNPPSQATGDCSLCHETTDWSAPKTLPNGHMPIPGTQTCSVCHTGNLSTTAGYATLASIPILHTGITSGCAQCHGGATQLTFYNNNDNPKAAASLSPAHIPAFNGEDCGSCHAPNYVAGGFGPMNMTQPKHAFVPGACTTCHEAGLSFYMGAASPALQGRPADHNTGQMLAPNDCSICHTTANWNSNSLPAGHMPNPASQACSMCHTTAPSDYSVATLAANSILHTGISGNCGQCHGGTAPLTWYNNFTPKDAVLSPSHIPFLAGADCGSCHASSTYAAGSFGPMNMTQAKHAFVASSCNTCHEKGLSFYMGAASPALQGRPADHSSGQMLAPNDCSICHTTANWNSTSLPAGHMPNPAAQACTLCHTTAPNDYSVATLAANSVLHTGISNNCSQCHGGTAPLTWYNNFTPKDAVLSPSHIPYLAGADCGSCHASSTYAAGAFGPMNMNQAKHAFVPTSCNTCHEAGLSFYMGAASPALQGRPADHNAGQMVAPNDCSICHTTASWNSNSLPAGHMPNPAAQACTVCHTTAPNDYSLATLASHPVLHTGITSGCITCHGAPNSTPPVFYLNFTPKDALLSPVHIPTGATPCEDCHQGTAFTSFSGVAMTSAMHTSMFTVIGSTCDACHNRVTPALGFYGVTNLQTRPGDHNSGGMATQDCSNCHSPRNWNSAQVKKAAKAPATTHASVSAVVTAASPASGAGPVRGDARPRMAVSHIGVTGACTNCHNGILAQGKGASHIASNNACENCHTISAWLPARFDHQGITATCASCHNGAIAPGEPARHLVSNLDCAACHGTLAWTPAKFNHVGVAATCQSCHNGVTATGKQATHVVTTKDCSSCHATLSWITPPAPAAPLRPLIRAPKSGPHSATGPDR
jgi:hypothetical protein